MGLEKSIQKTILWDYEEIMKQLQYLGTLQTRNTYINHGAHEPLFGVTTGSMKPLAKKIKKNYKLSISLYASGNYDAMYFAGIIADPSVMTQTDFEVWIEMAYFQGLSDYVVAVTLAETDFAMEVANRWIKNEKELHQSAGWSCYTWLLSFRLDDYFDKDIINGMLTHVECYVHESPNWVRYAMNGFIIAVGISYLPLYEEAIRTAKSVGSVQINMGNTSCKTPIALDYIEKAKKNGGIGFKRKKGRC